VLALILSATSEDQDCRRCSDCPIATAEEATYAFARVSTNKPASALPFRRPLRGWMRRRGHKLSPCPGSAVSAMPRIKPRSSRRVPPPKNSAFDHEITLADHGAEGPPQRVTSLGPEGGLPVGPSTTALLAAESSPGPSARGNGDSREQSNPSPVSPSSGPAVEIQEPTPTDIPLPEASSKDKRVSRPEPESAIDILYENERGGFLCGVALFSSRALGNLDPPPWTNSAHRPSPTDIHTAQVPDPSWEWAWPEWRVNHGEGTDEGGWQYSFMFAKAFAWHGPKWYNSFVRRRAWTRKRVTKIPGISDTDPHLLDPQYFTVHPASEIRRSSSRASSRPGSKASISQLSNATAGMEGGKPYIEDVETLLDVLRRARIDREKIEAVDNFLEHGAENLVRLQDEMHEIMSLFVFQASRKALLTRLTQVYGEAAQKRDGGDQTLGERVDNLAAAIEHADEEVRKLEYWSDIKAMAEGGDSKGAVDHQQGWDNKWRGLDKSGPAQPPEPGVRPAKGSGCLDGQ